MSTENDTPRPDERDGEGSRDSDGTLRHTAALSGSRRGGPTFGDDATDVQMVGPADLGPTANPEAEGQAERDDLFGGDASRS